MACFPEEKLFHGWQQQDEVARRTIWARLWELKTPIGYHFCLPAFLGYRDGGESARDVAHEAFYAAWEKIDLAVQSGQCEWQGCPEFNAYFKKIYIRTLIAGIKAKQRHFRTEISFEDDLSAAFLSQRDQGIKRVETKLAIGNLVFHYSYTAERLRKSGDNNLAEVAQAIVTFIKHEVANLTIESERIDGTSSPVEIIRDRAIGELLDEIIHDSQVDLGKQICPESFPVFLMRELCGFALADELRSKYCHVLGISFTVRELNGRRRRITQRELMNAHKTQKRVSPRVEQVDEAYEKLSAYLRCRNLVDKRWSRFKQAVDRIDPSRLNHQHMVLPGKRL